MVCCSTKFSFCEESIAGYFLCRTDQGFSGKEKGKDKKGLLEALIFFSEKKIRINPRKSKEKEVNLLVNAGLIIRKGAEFSACFEM
jgi:hypothetical protein